ncbi:hypothetical protein [Sphaerothrix gracilis]|uniref:hypothetical protein n=1 Tax=Sphaerothrix gracilis TaxID=3151835 RepID=UPI0031FC9D2E
MTNQPLAAPESSNELKAIALQRVVALGGQWLSDAPEQLLSHFKRQAEQLLELRAQLQERQRQLQECQAELQQLQDEQRQGSVAPFRREPSAPPKAPKRPGRKPGHAGDWSRRRLATLARRCR